MEILLIDTDWNMIEAWKLFFENQYQVKIQQGDLTKVKNCDAIVSPANSFGFMDGGVDYFISMRLGWDLEKRLQKQIQNLPEGELLVGKALVIETFDNEIPYLISAPTMRIPTNINIPNSINAYLAMKAVLIEATHHQNINSIALTGFCTGAGNMSYKISAKQMFLAYKEIILGEKKVFSSFAESQDYHWQINPLGILPIQ